MEVRRYLQTLFVLFSLSTGNVWALGFGEARALSYLGQPLHLEVALSGASATQLDSARISIGSRADFERLSMQSDVALSRLKLALRNTPSGWVVDIRSRHPFNDPFVEFPLRLRHAGGQIIKAVTVLLDPPTYIRPATRQRPPATTSAQRVQVKPGDTLWPIAQRTKPAQVSTQQMMMALLRRNPNAFVNGNINRLRSGAVLILPNAQEIRSASIASARSQVDQQMQAWRAETSPSATPARPVESAADTAPTPTPESDDHAKLRVLQPTDETGKDRRKQVLLSQEEIERQRLDQTQLAAQLQQIRDEVAHMERLLALKDEQIAALQAIVSTQAKLAQSAPTASQTAPAPNPPVKVTPKPAAQPIKPAPNTASAAATPRALDKPSPSAADRIPTLWWAALLLAPLVWFLWQRRQPAPQDDISLAERPEVVNAPPPPYAGTNELPLPVIQSPASEPEPPIKPALDQPNAQPVGSPQEPDSLLDEALAEVARFPNESLPGGEPDINEADLAELAAQLNVDLDELEQALPDNQTDGGNIGQFWEDIEASEGQISSTAPKSEASDSINLDMARAYLELGDREGAVDILEQVLGTTDDPAIRDQVQALLEHST